MPAASPSPTPDAASDTALDAAPAADVRLAVPPPHRVGRAALAARLFQLLQAEAQQAARAQEDEVVVASLARWR